jgi:hypothetical protein
MAEMSDEEQSDDDDVQRITVDNGRVTDIECYSCGDAYFVERGADRWCPNCQFAPDRHVPSDDNVDAWQRFWNRRSEYGDDERKYCVGGFVGAYTVDGQVQY